MTRRISLTLALVTLLLSANCASEPSPTPDLVATQVAVLRAAAATLTAEAPTPAPSASPTPRPTATPTPLPCDFSAFVLAEADLPAGFVDASSVEWASSVETDKSDDLSVQSSFSFLDEQRGHFVLGWTYLLSTPNDREQFDQAIHQPEYPLVHLMHSFPITAMAALDSPPGLGDTSRAVSAEYQGEHGPQQTLEWVLFRRDVVRASIMTTYPTQDSPRTQAAEVARLVDNRIVQALGIVPGTIPTATPEGQPTAITALTPAAYSRYENPELGYSAWCPDGWDVQVEDILAPVGGEYMGKKVSFTLPDSLDPACRPAPRVRISLILLATQPQLPSDEYYLEWAVDLLQDRETVPRLLSISFVEVGGYRGIEMVTDTYGSTEYSTILETEDRWLHIEAVGDAECPYSITPIYTHIIAGFEISPLPDA